MCKHTKVNFENLDKKHDCCVLVNYFLLRVSDFPNEVWQHACLLSRLPSKSGNMHACYQDCHPSLATCMLAIKIAIQVWQHACLLSRLCNHPRQLTHVASGQGSHWVFESPTIFHFCVTRPSEIFVNFVLNIFTLLAVTQSVDNIHTYHTYSHC